MHNTLQAKQRQSQLFQQQENANILYSVNWSAELDTDNIIKSTWAVNSGTGSITDDNRVISTNNFGTSVNSVNNLRMISFSNQTETLVGDYIEFTNLSGVDQSQVDFFSTGRFLVLSSDSSFVEIANNGFTSSISGTLNRLKPNSLKQSSVRIKGNVGKVRVTNQITTESGNIMERQVIVNVLSNTDRYADDYYYYGHKGA